MRKVFAALMGMALAGAFVTTIRPVAAAPMRADQMVTVAVTGAEEVGSPGDPDGAGTAMVTFKSDSGEICWDLKVSNITLPSVGAHIHEGAKGTAGPVVVPFSAPDANGIASGCTKPDAALMTRIMQNPENFYVNIHTSDFPAGAVRGQLTTLTDAEAPPAPATVPATMPDTGTGSARLRALVAFALFALAGGMSLTIGARRRTTTD